MILKYKNNFYKYIEDENRWLIGKKDIGYTWFNYDDEDILNKVFYCGELVS